MASDTCFRALKRQYMFRTNDVTHVGLTDWYLCNPTPPMIRRAWPAFSSPVLPEDTDGVSF
jgi:hypothetical protein